MQQPRNPFELMMNPAAVLEAVERSSRLAALRSRVYRPLDAPVLRRKRGDEDEARPAHQRAGPDAAPPGHDTLEEHEVQAADVEHDLHDPHDPRDPNDLRDLHGD